MTVSSMGFAAAKKLFEGMLNSLLFAPMWWHDRYEALINPKWFTFNVMNHVVLMVQESNWKDSQSIQ